MKPEIKARLEEAIELCEEIGNKLDRLNSSHFDMRISRAYEYIRKTQEYLEKVGRA